MYRRKRLLWLECNGKAGFLLEMLPTKLIGSRSGWDRTKQQRKSFHLLEYCKQQSFATNRVLRNHCNETFQCAGNKRQATESQALQFSTSHLEGMNSGGQPQHRWRIPSNVLSVTFPPGAQMSGAACSISLPTSGGSNPKPIGKELVVCMWWWSQDMGSVYSLTLPQTPYEDFRICLGIGETVCLGIFKGIHFSLNKAAQNTNKTVQNSIS